MHGLLYINPSKTDPLEARLISFDPQRVAEDRMKCILMDVLVESGQIMNKPNKYFIFNNDDRNVFGNKRMSAISLGLTIAAVCTSNLSKVV